MVTQHRHKTLVWSCSLYRNWQARPMPQQARGWQATWLQSQIPVCAQGHKSNHQHSLQATLTFSPTSARGGNSWRRAWAAGSLFVRLVLWHKDWSNQLASLGGLRWGGGAYWLCACRSVCVTMETWQCGFYQVCMCDNGDMTVWFLPFIFLAVCIVCLTAFFPFPVLTLHLEPLHPTDAFHPELLHPHGNWPLHPHGNWCIIPWTASSTWELMHYTLNCFIHMGTDALHLELLHPHGNWCIRTLILIITLYFPTTKIHQCI